MREARALRVAAQLEAELAHAIEVVEDLARAARTGDDINGAITQAMDLVSRRTLAANG